jgi:hypothetical protein
MDLYSSGWCVSGSAVPERSRIPVSSTTRVKSAIVFSLTVEGSASLDCRILGRFRPVRIVTKRDAMSDQSAPCTGRQSSHRLGWGTWPCYCCAVSKRLFDPINAGAGRTKNPAWRQSLRGFSLNQGAPLRPARQQPTCDLLNEWSWARSRMGSHLQVRSRIAPRPYKRRPPADFGNCDNVQATASVNPSV